MSSDAKPLKVGAPGRPSPPSARECKIGIEACGPAVSPEPLRHVTRQADEAVLRLARLLGRQIAREQFERRQDKSLRSLRKQETP